jgi:3-oxoacyl-[acyl-carrier-protein] synthase II
MVAPAEPGSRLAETSSLKPAARFLHLGLAAAAQAWQDAGLDSDQADYDRDRVAVIVGSAFGGVDLLEQEQARMARRQTPAASPFLIPGLVINQAAGQIAQHLRLYGPSLAPANACASGGHSIILGAMFLRSGSADLAICGASEGAFTPPIVNGFATMKALLPRKPGDRSEDNPGAASRPFSADRAGFVLAEGAGMVVLATESAIRRLGLKVQAELAGWALNSDGHHLTMPCQERIGACVRLALKHADVRSSEDVSYYNAHGTSTTLNDQVETRVLKDVFGEVAYQLPISSVKGALGHALGAASAIEAAVCIRAIRDQLIPPTINHIPDPELDLDYVPNQARMARLDTVMSASFGFGGTNNVLVFRKAEIR